MTNSEKGLLGERYVRDYLISKGFTIDKIKENGSDLTAKKNGKTMMVEVKTTSSLIGGIPDMHTTEFRKKNGKWLFVADYLYIIRLNDKFKPIQLDIVSRKEIDTYAGSHRTITKIRTTQLDRALNNRKTGKSIIIK